MKTKSKIDWLKGYLESLEYGDSISKAQFQVLKEKLISFFDEIESDDNDDDDYEDEIYNHKLQKKQKINLKDKGEDLDDMPY